MRTQEGLKTVIIQGDVWAEETVREADAERMIMELPFHFPDEGDTIYEQALAYRQLTPTERLRVLLDLIASGMALIQQSPHRQAGQRLQEEQEAEWQRAQKELFARYDR